MNGALYRDQQVFLGSFTGAGYPWGAMIPGSYFVYSPAEHVTIAKACRSINERGTYPNKVFVAVRSMWQCRCFAKET